MIIFLLCIIIWWSTGIWLSIKTLQAINESEITWGILLLSLFLGLGGITVLIPYIENCYPNFWNKEI